MQSHKWTPHTFFLLMLNTSIWLNFAPLRDMFQNLSDLDFDISMSLKVKCDRVTGLPIYDFLAVSISNIWPNSAPLPDISFQIQSDFEEIDLSRSLKSNVIALMPAYFPIHV